MLKETFLYVVIAALAGFIGGFLLANSLNRSELQMMQSQAMQPAASNSASVNDSTATTLSDAEIQNKIKAADANPGDFNFQKGLGIALYRYAAMKQEPRFLVEANRILSRANELNSADFDVLVGLGHTRFDIAYNDRDAKLFDEARSLYLRALEIRPTDPDVRTDLGIAYFLPEPPDFAKAEAELKRVIEQNPRHDRSLQWLIQVYVKQKKIADAESALAKLKEINPANTSIGELTNVLAAARSEGK